MAKLGTLRLKQQAEAGATLTVRDPFGAVTDDGDLPALLAADGTPATLTLLGADSETARTLDYRRAAAAQTRLYASAFGQRKKSMVMTADDISEQSTHDLERLVALTVGWHGFEDEDGEALAFSSDAVRDLYAQNAPIREQAMAFIADRAAFFGRSSTHSAPTSSTSSI